MKIDEDSARFVRQWLGMGEKQREAVTHVLREHMSRDFVVVADLLEALDWAARHG